MSVFVFFDANTCLRRRVSLDHGRAFGPRRRQPDHVAWLDGRGVVLLVHVDGHRALAIVAFDDADCLELRDSIGSALVALVIADLDGGREVSSLLGLFGDRLIA